jgi:hypothetical protein
MKDVHAFVGIATLGLNVVAALWGGVAWMRNDPSLSFWYVLRVAQASVVVEVALGVVLLIDGRSPPDSLHYVYAVAPLVVALATEAMRGSAAVAEIEALGEGVDTESLPRREQVMLARRCSCGRRRAEGRSRKGAPAPALIAADEDDRRAVSCVWKAVQAGAGAGLCFCAFPGVPAYFASASPSAPASGSAGRSVFVVVTVRVPLMPRSAWSPTVHMNSYVPGPIVAWPDSVLPGPKIGVPPRSLPSF